MDTHKIGGQLPAKAVVFRRAGDVEIQEIPVGAPGSGEVQVRTTCSVVSAGTEGWILHDKITVPCPFPLVTGVPARW